MVQNQVGWQLLNSPYPSVLTSLCRYSVDLFNCLRRLRSVNITTKCRHRFCVFVLYSLHFQVPRCRGRAGAVLQKLECSVTWAQVMNCCVKPYRLKPQPWRDNKLMEKCLKEKYKENQIGWWCTGIKWQNQKHNHENRQPWRSWWASKNKDKFFISIYFNGSCVTIQHSNLHLIED